MALKSSMAAHCCQLKFESSLRLYIWNFKLKSRMKSIFNIGIYYKNSIDLILNCIMNLISGNCMIVFCRTRIRLRKPSIAFLWIYSVRCSFINIQDTKFKWCVLRNLQINGNFEHFKNVWWWRPFSIKLQAAT